MGFNQTGQQILSRSAATTEAGGNFEVDGKLTVAGRSDLDGNTGLGTAGAGITAGSGTIIKTSATKEGGIITTRLLIDLTGLNSSAANDIIGVDAAADCHWGQITDNTNGTIFGGRMTCLEVPVGGELDIDLFSAIESTGVEDTPMNNLTQRNILLTNADWDLTNGRAITLFPKNAEYIYLAGSSGGVDGTYTAGRFLIEFYGYDE